MVLSTGEDLIVRWVGLGDLRVDFLAEDFNNLYPFLTKVWISDNDKVNFRDGLELKDRLDGQALVVESQNGFFITDGVIVNPAVVTS